MKVIGINGSPRKGWNSATMLDSALKGAAAAGAQTERIDLFDLNFSGCRSCFACKKLGGASFGRCAVCDDLKPVLDKILDADALVISAPIYFGDVTGAVRNLFERLWFPGLTYSKDGTLAYDKRMKVGLIYTMNHNDETAFSAMFEQHKGTFNWLLGEARHLCAVETMQFDDYSLYASSMFDPEARKKRHEEVFPQDCKNAYELGKSLVS